MTEKPTTVALLADPHYHDIDRNGPFGSVRSLGDVLAASRVVNESHHSLRAALDDLVRRGVKVVVIAGDLTEDGQRADIDALMTLLAGYGKAHGLMFFATLGNHDTYGLSGRLHTKSFLDAGGRAYRLSSDPARTDASYDAAMHTEGYAATLTKMRALGFFRQPHFRHWETPFGSSDALSDRIYPARSKDGRNTVDLIDASYLAEPVDGLWLLSLDSNVYLPADGAIEPASETAFVDSKDGKWDDVVAHRPYLVDWISAVRRRADALGKTLIAFSHYAIAAPEWERAYEGQFAGGAILSRTGADPATIQTMIASGLGVHFSGHSHVATVTKATDGTDTLVDIAIPALCSFPSGYRLVHIDGGALSTETIAIRETSSLSSLFDLYRKEAKRDPVIAAALHGLLGSSAFGPFIDNHLDAAVRNGLARKHFGEALATAAVRTTLREGLSRIGAAAETLPRSGGDVRLIDAMVDWYRLWRGGDVALRAIPIARLEAYRQAAVVAERVPEPADPTSRDVLHFVRKLGLLAQSPIESSYVWTPGNFAAHDLTVTLP